MVVVAMMMLPHAGLAWQTWKTEPVFIKNALVHKNFPKRVVQTILLLGI